MVVLPIFIEVLGNLRYDNVKITPSVQ